MKSLFALVLLLFAAPAHAGSMSLLGAGSSGPAGPCAQATTYLARTTGGNEGGNAANMTTLICGLVSDGVITGNLSTTGCGTTLDVLDIYAQQNSADSLLNLCGTNYSTTIVGASISFTAYSGYGNMNNNNHLVTNFNSTTATSPNYTQNSASYGFWTVAVVAESAFQMGTQSLAVTGESNLVNNLSSAFYARVNQGTTGSVPTPGTKGLFVAERPSSANVIPYWNGAAQATQTATSQAPVNLPFLVGIGGTSGAGTLQTIAEAHIGAALGATLNLALYTRLRTYMTAVGVP